MKSNLRIRLLVSFAAVCLAANSLKAEAARLSGSVTLPSQTRWGLLLLESGTYQFTLNQTGAGGLFTIRQGSRGIGMMAAGAVSFGRSSASNPASSTMSIAGNRVQSLYLAPLETTYRYSMPKPAKEMVTRKSNMQRIALSIQK